LKMIPKEILDEHRQAAQEALRQDKPRNWVAAGVIIAIWLLALAWVTTTVVRLAKG